MLQVILLLLLCYRCYGHGPSIKDSTKGLELLLVLNMCFSCEDPSESFQLLFLFLAFCSQYVGRIQTDPDLFFRGFGKEVLVTYPLLNRFLEAICPTKARSRCHPQCHPTQPSKRINA